jgi:hypothetical protein
MKKMYFTPKSHLLLFKTHFTYLRMAESEGEFCGWLDVGASYIIERADVVFGVDLAEAKSGKCHKGVETLEKFSFVNFILSKEIFLTRMN